MLWSEPPGLTFLQLWNASCKYSGGGPIPYYLNGALSLQSTYMLVGSSEDEEESEEESAEEEESESEPEPERAATAPKLKRPGFSLQRIGAQALWGLGLCKLCASSS